MALLCSLMKSPDIGARPGSAGRAGAMGFRHETLGSGDGGSSARGTREFYVSQNHKQTEQPNPTIL